AFAHHQTEILARASPGRVARLVDDMAQIVEPSRIGRLAGGEPGLTRLPALPRARGKAENFHLDAAAVERARQDIGPSRRGRDRPSAYRTRIVEQERDHGFAETGFLLVLERERMERIDHDAREPRRIEQSLLQVELPGAVLLRHQTALQPVG